tara:strand:+ start:159 stop:485 length:327 start_codon:yes stop_codon:yes gene_type:complete
MIMMQSWYENSKYTIMLKYQLINHKEFIIKIVARFKISRFILNAIINFLIDKSIFYNYLKSIRMQIFDLSNLKNSKIDKSSFMNCINPNYLTFRYDHPILKDEFLFKF